MSFEVTVLTLVGGVALGILFCMFFPRKEKGVSPSTTDVVILACMILTGLTIMNYIQFSATEKTASFFEATLIEIFQAGGAFGLAAISVYLTQKHYEEKVKTETIDEIIAPLLFEIEKIRKYMQLIKYSWGYLHQEYSPQWNAMKNGAMEIRARNTDPRIPEFYERLNTHKKKYNEIYKYFFSQIDEIFEKELSTTGERYEKPRHFTFKPEYEPPDNILYHKYIIFGLNPISYMKKIDDTFEENKLTLNIENINIRGASVFVDLNYVDIKRECENFFKAIEKLLEGNAKIIALRKERDNLIKMSSSLHKKLNHLIQ